jgi:hypothetical protein
MSGGNSWHQGTTNQRSDANAADEKYTPATPSNWRPTVPTLVSQALDLLAAITVTVRSWLGTSTSTIYVDNVAGSDTTGTGAVGRPYQTLAWALQQRPFIPASAFVTVQLVETGTPYDLDPASIKSLSWTTIQGNQLLQSTRTYVDGGGSATAGIIITLTSGAVPADDALVGQLAQWNDGGLIGQWGVIWKNVGMTCYVSNGNAFDGTYVNPAAGGGTSVSIYRQTQLHLVAYTSIEEVFAFGFADLEVDADAVDQNVIELTATNEVTWTRCRLYHLGSLIARGGSIALNTSHCSGFGQGDSGGTDTGVLTVDTGATCLLLGGSVVASDPSGPGNYAALALYGTLYGSGEAVFRALNGALYGGLFSVGGLVLGRAAAADGTVNVWRWADFTVPCLQANASAEGAGGWLDLPTCDQSGGGNATSHNYFVSAQGGPQVHLHGGNAAGAAGTLASSATGGSSLSSRAIDGTVVYGGLPSSASFYQFPAAPAFAAAQLVPSTVQTRRVVAYANVDGSAATQQVDLQVEITAGSGTWHTVARVASQNPNGAKVTGTLTADVPGGFHYQFVRLAGTETLGANYAYTDYYSG